MVEKLMNIIKNDIVCFRNDDEYYLSTKDINRKIKSELMFSDYFVLFLFLFYYFYLNS